MKIGIKTRKLQINNSKMEELVSVYTDRRAVCLFFKILSKIPLLNEISKLVDSNESFGDLAFH